MYISANNASQPVASRQSSADRFDAVSEPVWCCAEVQGARYSTMDVVVAGERAGAGQARRRRSSQSSTGRMGWSGIDRHRYARISSLLVRPTQSTSAPSPLDTTSRCDGRLPPFVPMDQHCGQRCRIPAHHAYVPALYSYTRAVYASTFGGPDCPPRRASDRVNQAHDSELGAGRPCFASRVHRFMALLLLCYRMRLRYVHSTATEDDIHCVRQTYS